MPAKRGIIVSTSLVFVVLILVLYIPYRRLTDGNINFNLFDAEYDFRSEIRQPQVSTLPEAGVSRSILTQDNSVRDCISGSILRHLDDAPTNPFAITVFSSGETMEQRKKSFQRFYWSDALGKTAYPSVDKGLKSVIGSESGSILNSAQEAMAVLHTLINELKRATNKDKVKILDIPCGDFKWMHRFLQQRTDVSYTGMDIIPELIENHGRAFKGNPDWRFVNADAVVTSLKGEYDLVLCRMMLQHLTTPDVMKVLKNIGESGSKYLLTTTSLAGKYNGNLSVPNVSKKIRYRPINMELPPFTLVPPICISRDGPKGASHGLYLGLWKIPLRQLSQCNMHKTKLIEPNAEDIWVC